RSNVRKTLTVKITAYVLCIGLRRCQLCFDVQLRHTESLLRREHECPWFLF
ncbi:hypothetical protein LSAT2_030214, partial [Lamellibrachia satsuma]